MDMTNTEFPVMGKEAWQSIRFVAGNTHPCDTIGRKLGRATHECELPISRVTRGLVQVVALPIPPVPHTFAQAVRVRAHGGESQCSLNIGSLRRVPQKPRG